MTTTTKEAPDYQQRIAEQTAQAQENMQQILAKSLDSLQSVIPEHIAELKHVTDEFVAQIGIIASSALVEIENRQKQPDTMTEIKQKAVRLAKTLRSRWHSWRKEHDFKVPLFSLVRTDSHHTTVYDQAAEDTPEPLPNHSSDTPHQPVLPFLAVVIHTDDEAHTPAYVSTQVTIPDSNGILAQQATPAQQPNNDQPHAQQSEQDEAHKEQHTSSKKNKNKTAIAAAGLVLSFIGGVGVGYLAADEEPEVTYVPAWANQNIDQYQQLEDTYDPPVVFNIMQTEPGLYQKLSEADVSPRVIANIMSRTELYQDFQQIGVEDSLIYDMFDSPDRLEYLVDQGLTASQIEDVYLSPQAYDTLVSTGIDAQTAARILQYPSLTETIESSGLTDPVIAHIVASPQLFYGLTFTDLTLPDIIQLLQRDMSLQQVVTETPPPEPQPVVDEEPIIQVEQPPVVVVVEQPEAVAPPVAPPVVQPVAPAATTPPVEAQPTPAIPVIDLRTYIEFGHGFVDEIQDTFTYLNGNQAFQIYEQVIERQFNGDAFTSAEGIQDIGAYWHAATGNFRINQSGLTKWRPEVFVAMVDMITAHGWDKQ